MVPAMIAALIAMAGTAAASARSGRPSSLATVSAQQARHQPAAGERGAPVRFDGKFVPADGWASQLRPQQRVMMVIEDRSERSAVEPVVAVGALGDPFSGQLVPGRYRFGAFVFSDDNPLDESEVVGGALMEFSVEPGEPPFRLDIAIRIASSDEEVMRGSGSLVAGQRESFRVRLSGSVTYRIHVVAIGAQADLDLFVYDEGGNLVASDVRLDADASCVVEPRWTGPFEIVVACSSGKTSYGLVVQT